MVSKIPSPFTNPFVVVTSVRNALMLPSTTRSIASSDLEEGPGIYSFFTFSIYSVVCRDGKVHYLTCSLFVVVVVVVVVVEYH